MLIDRTHKPWFFASVLALSVAGSAYWVISKGSPHGASGGSVFGLLFGIFGSLMMVFAALLAVRKRLPTWRVGSAQLWLRGHLWLGTLGFVLILFHAGFKWGGLLENLLWISFGLVVVTGFAGVLLQQVIPRLLTTRVPLETMVAQIPFLSQTMQFRADQLIAKQAGLLDVDFESLKPFAEEVLKQQRVLKRESDFPKELAKVYANVPLPDAESKKPPTIVAAEIISTKPTPATKGTSTSPLPVGEGGQRPSEGSVTNTVTPAEATPAPKPKSPLELMREKAAAKAVESSPTPAAEPIKKLSPIEQMRAKAAAAKAAEPTAEAPAPVADAPPSVPEKKLSPIELMRAKQAAKTVPVAEVSPTVAEVAVVEPAAAVPAPIAAAEPEKKLSPIEQMRAKAAAKAAAVPVAESPVVDASPVLGPAAEPEKKLSPIEQMRAKQAAKAAAVPVAESPVVDAPPALGPAAEPEKKLSPIEQMRAKAAAKAAPVASTPAPSAESPAAAATEVAPEKKLSPLEQMKAKLAAAKPASTDSSAESHKPLTIEKPAAATKPTIAKPAVEKPVATAFAKPVAKLAAPIPPALLAELKDFHLRVVRPFLNNGRSPQYRLDDDIAARRVFAQLRSDLPAELHDVLLQLQNLCDERRQFNTQLRLHRWMHWWLILHIPPSIALMVLFVAHVIVSLRVVPFGK